MSGNIFRQHSSDEKVCIIQYEQKEYDSCSWENEEFGKIFQLFITCFIELFMMVRMFPNNFRKAKRPSRCPY